jgi:hypothetical protein
MKERMEDLRKTSGEVTYSDPLTTFFYLLMRDELAAGKVEAMVQDVIDSTDERLFTNGWLARYANNLADELKNARVAQLQKALDQAFASAEEETKQKEKKEAEDKIKNDLAEHSDTLDDDVLAKLEQKLIQAAEDGKVTPVGKEVDPRTAAEEAKEAVQKLVDQGHLKQEQADDLISDRDDAAEGAPKAEEVKVDVKEEDKVTSAEAKEIVDHAVELSEAVEDLKQEQSHEAMVNQITKAAVEEIQEVEDLKVIKNSEVVSDGEEWREEHISHLDSKGDVSEGDTKWKNTNKELQKIEDETTTEEE